MLKELFTIISSVSHSNLFHGLRLSSSSLTRSHFEFVRCSANWIFELKLHHKIISCYTKTSWFIHQNIHFDPKTSLVTDGTANVILEDLVLAILVDWPSSAHLAL